MRRQLFLSLVSVVGMAGSSEPRSVKVAFPRVETAPSMAADADLSTWRGAWQITDFGMIMPDDKGTSRWPTTVHGLWGPDALYVAVEARDPEPSQVRAWRHRRDQFSDLDLVALDVDASGQGRSSIRFIASPLGGQMEALVTDSTGEDSSYDCLWDAAGTRTAEGYVLKFRIPYTSLRRSPGDWGIRVLRILPRERRFGVVWPAMSRDVSCDLCQMAKVSGAPVSQASAPFLVIPTMSFKRDERWDAASARLGVPDSQRRLGMDLRYAGSALTLDGTYRPDFSNVEADVDPLQINSRFKVMYPEKRPFFLEGMDLLGTAGAQRQFFSRALLDPQYGAKASGQTDRTAWSLLHVRDQAGGAALASEGAEGVDGRATRDFAGAMHVKFDGRGSGMTFVGTDRALVGQDGGGRSAGLYVNQFLGHGFQFRGSAVGATARLPQAEGSVSRVRGSATSSELEWENRNWSGFASASATGRNLVLVSGFTDLQGYRNQAAGGGWRGRWNAGRLSMANLRVRGYRMLDWDGRLLEQALGLNGFVETSGRVTVSMGWDPTGRNQAQGRTIATRSLWTNVFWGRHARFQPSLNLSQGRTQDLSTGEPAHNLSASLSARGALGSFSYSASLRENRLEQEADGSLLVRARRWTASGEWALPADLYAQFQGFIVHYDRPTHQTTDRYLRVLLGWQPNAFTHAYLGWSGRTRLDPTAAQDPERLVGRGLFAKFAYAVQF